MISKEVASIMAKLVATVPQLTLYKGFGHCLYGSELLRQELSKIGIQAQLLQGKYFNNNTQAKQCQQALISIIDSITDVDTVFSDIKQAYIKRGGLAKDVGHMVVLLPEKICLDITSGQFGLPQVYSQDMFSHIWLTKSIATVTLSNDEDNFFIGSVDTVESSVRIATESILNKW